MMPRRCRLRRTSAVARSRARSRRRSRAAADGALATFVGLVRDHNAGRRVLWLDYEAFAPLAVKAFEQIGAEAAERWPGVQLAIHHRTGRVAIGEAERRDCRRVAAPRRRLRRVPLRDRARQADRADLEARALRGWRGLDRGGDGGSGRRGGAAGRAGAGVHVTIRLFARLREMAGASELSARGPRGATASDAWTRWCGSFPSMAGYSRNIACAVNEEYARLTDAAERRRRGRLLAARVGRMSERAQRVSHASGAGLRGPRRLHGGPAGRSPRREESAVRG